jgi:hypothetical protein
MKGKKKQKKASMSFWQSILYGAPQRLSAGGLE